MNHERHERFIDAWARAWNGGELDALDAILAPDYVRHESSGREVALAEHKDQIRALHLGFSDVTSVVQDIFGTADRLAVRWSSTGTHDGPYLGVPPTGRRIEVHGIALSRVRAWRIEEEWVTWDPRELLDVLGVFTPHSPG